ncbi:leucine-rich repeat domain-containing protein [Aquimarina rubra]|uniref:Leucine-rich repeat domain-containing protein n=1 Tax=Aquimarina rubra TaxID=1920033 RepID=A0ABW5LA90_9FLAO
MKNLNFRVFVLLTGLIVSCTKEIDEDLITTLIVEDFENVSNVLLKIIEDNPDHTLNWDGNTDNLGNWEGIVIENDKLIGLDIENKGITVLTPDINLLKDLTVLNLKDNDLLDIPNEIFDLKELRELSLSGEKAAVTTMDDFLGGLYSLTNLKSLYLDFFPVLDIDGISNLSSLEKLTLMNLSMNRIPIDFFNLQELKSIELVDNANLAIIPEGFNVFNKLTTLRISGNPGIQEFNLSIFEVSTLQKLDLSHNGIGYASDDQGAIPNGIGMLLQLTDLNLENNRITSLSNQIGELQNLKNLNLRNNAIVDIPVSLGTLTNLDILDISGNLQLNEIPEEVCNLQDMGTTIIIDGVCEELRVSSRYANNPSEVSVGLPFFIDIDIDAVIDPVFIDGDGPFDLDFGEIGFEVHEVNKNEVTVRDDVPGQVLVTRSDTQQFINGFRNMTFELFAPFVVSSELSEGRTYRVRLFNAEFGTVKTYLPAYELTVIE